MTKELKSRIRTLKSTHKITSAMKIVSATSFNRLKSSTNHMFGFLGSLTQLKPYMTEPMRDCTHERLLIIVGGDRGLCGGYNTAIRKRASAYTIQFPNSHIGYIGAKTIIKGQSGIFTETVQRLKHWETLLKTLAPLWQTYTCIDVLFTQFQSLYDQQIILKEIRAYPEKTQDDLILDETSTNIGIIIHTAQVMKAIVHAQLCEFSSRMLSMENATQNAEKMIQELQLMANKIRQSMITKELSETVAGSSI